MIISFGDLRLVGSARQCPSLAVWALWLGGVVFQRLHQNSYPGRLVFSLLRRWGGVGVVFQKVVPESSMGCVSKVGVVLQQVVPESPRLDGVVFQKLGWCSKKLSQNPRWGGVPKVGVVFQKVVAESPLCILLIFFICIFFLFL